MCATEFSFGVTAPSKWLYYNGDGIFEYTWENNGSVFLKDSRSHQVLTVEKALR